MIQQEWQITFVVLSHLYMTILCHLILPIVKFTTFSLAFPHLLLALLSLLRKIKPDSSMGPDGLHPMLLKRCSKAISIPLYLLFNMSLNLQEVPESWKASNVIPLYKKGVHSDPLNYRPISLTSVCCKTIERLIVKSMNEYLEENHILSDHQFGFRSGRSVLEQILITYNFITYEYDWGKIVLGQLWILSRPRQWSCHLIRLHFLDTP